MSDDGKRHTGMQTRGRLIPDKKEKYRLSLPSDTPKREPVKREGWHNGARVVRR